MTRPDHAPHLRARSREVTSPATGAILILSAIVMILLQPATLIAMVIAPPCTGIMHLADVYKVASVCAFGASYYAFAWRRRSAAFALAIPVLQIAMGYAFMAYLNSLPYTCPSSAPAVQRRS